MRMRWILLVAFAAGCAAHTEMADDENEVDVALADVPAVVLEAARKAVPGIELSRAEKEVEKGVTVYDLEGTANGKRYEVEVDANGKVIEVEDAPDAGDDDHDGDDDDGKDSDDA